MMSHKAELNVRPRHVHFRGPIGQPGPEIVQIALNNSNPYSIAFKLRSLDPRRYTVRPRRGVINASSTIQIRIRFRPLHSERIESFNVNRQKLMILSVILLPEDTTEYGDLSVSVDVFY